MPKRTSTVAAIALLAGLAATASAQVVINEVLENPPSGGDDTWEFIELYGTPGYDLTGYMVALVKGGIDENGDDIPDGTDGAPEVDEAFTLDGWTIGPNGTFVLYITGSFGFTGIEPFLTPNPGYDSGLPESPTNKRFLNGASFATTHIPTVDTSGKLGNDFSSTYLLIRKRPNHAINGSGQSVYEPGYAWKKDTTPDVDFDGRLDFGDEDSLGVPVYYGHGLDGEQESALALEPCQIVDEIAWSNGGGKEYVLQGRGLYTSELSQTPGFNPDAISRLRYLSEPLMVGSTISSSGNLNFASIADDSWIYGTIVGNVPGTPDYTLYRPLFDDGSDNILGTADDELNILAPVDPAGPTYSYDGPGDDNPLEAPFFQYSGALDPSGTLLFEPYDTTGFRYTPGSPNDAEVGTPMASTEVGTQFRFVTGDLNFDGVVDMDDVALAESLLGRGLDDTTTLVRDFDNSDPGDDIEYTGWAFQAQDYNALLALVRMDLTDGTTGEWNSGVTATAADVAAVQALVPVACPADTNGDGILDNGDIGVFVQFFLAGNLAADFNGDGILDNGDIGAFVALFLAGCP